MMGALPQTAPTLSPLFAALTAAMPGATGEEGGFDQLIAGQVEAAAPAAVGATRFATPVLAAPVAAEQPAPTGEAAAVPTLPVPGKPAIQIAIAAKPQGETASLPIADPKPAAKPDAAPAADAVTVANWLLGTAGRFALTATAQPAKTPVAAKPGESETSEEGAAKTDAKTADATLSLALPMATAPAADRPVKADAPKAAASRDDAPALPMAAPKPRDAAPLPALASAEAPVAKPAAEPSMTVLFAQPATQAGGVVEAAKPAIVAERVLDLTSDDAWIEQLASDIAATRSASNDVSFRLMPRHLGRLDVSMMMGDEGMSLKLDTQHEATATIVTAAQVRLVDDLRQQGVRVADTQVTHTPTDAGRQSQQGQGRNPAQDAAHLIETATERDTRPETRDQERAGDRRGRFA